MSETTRWAAIARAAVSVSLIVGGASGSVLAQSSMSSQGWMLTPAGRQINLGDRPLGIASSPDGRTLLVSNNGQSTQSLMVIDRQSAVVRQTISYRAPEALFIGVAFSADGSRAYASAGGNNKIRTYAVRDQ
jgi:hypothetical protein